jgi:ribokinase
VLLLQLELPHDVVVAAARIGHNAGVTVILNPAPAPTNGNLDDLHGLIDIVVPNETEAQQLGTTTDAPSELTAARHLATRLGTSVVITLGADGCIGWDNDDGFRVEGHPVDVVDTVGAGDAFCGTLGAWIATGHTLHDAVVHANAAGALAVTKPGAEPSMPQQHDIVHLVTTRYREPRLADEAS